MKKSTKGALAAGAAAALLLGGAGTLAYWTDEGTVDGITLTAGHLTVDASDCATGTAQWFIDGDPDPVAFDPATGILIPGDTLTMECDIDIDVEGTHFTQVDIAATTPAALTDPWDELTITTDVAGSATGANDIAVTEAGPNTITVEVTVAWPYNPLDNDLNLEGDAGVPLDDIEITVTQNHLDD